uniref:Protein Wnt n=1 Tax=Meloidogyne hapla TaxID=6305 RepID=A0A1I8BE93_MELHA
MHFQEIRNGPYLGLDNANRLAVFLEMVESELNSILKNEECPSKVIFRALHRVQPAWTNSGDCPRSREERRVFGLIAYQARVCVRLPELIPHIINAASLTVDACQSAFADRRWNCSSILTAPNLSAELNSDTVTTTASIDPAASSLFQRNLTELSYKWKGCSDNVVHGRRISREWSDSRWRPNPAEAVNEIAARNRWNIVDTETNGGSDDYIEDDQIRRILKLKRHSPSKRNGQKARMNEFNNEIGRQVVDQSLYKNSCDVKTCWYTLPPIEHVVSILKKKYDNARPMLGSTTLGAMRKRWKHPESDDEQSLVRIERISKKLI